MSCMSSQSIPISAVIIACNAERTIERCLKSLSFADEIVVVDSLSDDSTVEIAKKYTPHVYSHTWEGYTAQKEFAVAKASNTWILWIDSDEELSSPLQEEMRNVAGNDFAACALARKVNYLGKWINYSGWYPDWVVRLFNREKSTFDGSVVHEKLIVEGKIRRLRGELYHYPYKDISHHLDKINRFTSLSAQKMFGESKTAGAGDLIVRPFWKILRMYIFKAGFRDGMHGMILAVMAGYYTFLKYAKLWHLYHTDPGSSA
ncbi:MAG: glycosyltransferase [Chitinivibrionales bacterium]|nr:glycosyltransferase [Chitinivibrionales bacterium]